MRAVLDPNVLIAAVLSPRGSPARLLLAWIDGAFDLVVSEALLDELGRALAYPKLRQRVDAEDAVAFVELLRAQAEMVADPDRPPPVRSTDSGDDYLIALAAAARALLVSGDNHLLTLRDRIPVQAPAEFLTSFGS